MTVIDNCCFMPGRSTMEPIFILHQVLKHKGSKERTLGRVWGPCEGLGLFSIHIVPGPIRIVQDVDLLGATIRVKTV